MEEIGLNHKPKHKPNGITKADKEARKSDDLIKEEEKRKSKKNIIKLKKLLRKKYTKLRNIRDDYQYKILYDIIKKYL